MKTTRRNLSLCCVLAVTGAASALAQDMPATQFAPVEIFTCNYREGKGPGDLDKVSDRFGKWADKNDSAPYSAWTMTPQYAPPEYMFDFGWLGVWPDGKAMGTGMDNWLSKGKDVAAEFYAVADCDSHVNFASQQIRDPKFAKWPASGVVTFADCKIEEMSKGDAAVTATYKWGKMLDDKKLPGAMWIFWPAVGAGDVDYSYKIVEVYENYKAFGQFYDYFGNGEGFRKYDELFNDLVSCDSARVYDSTLRRAGLPPRQSKK